MKLGRLLNTWFQFLIGTLETRAEVSQLTPEERVSIPHRYARNLASSSAFSAFMALFQFLIGTLETQCKKRFQNRIAMFQFLIGTLETSFCPTKEMSTTKFQFLIGTLETSRQAPFKIKSISVSIPHRYARNFCHFYNLFFQPVFQFLIGTLETLIEFADYYRLTGFNSS